MMLTYILRPTEKNSMNNENIFKIHCTDFFKSR